MAPISGAMKATMKLAMLLARPSRKVLSVAAMPAFQYCLKNSGKKPAMTVTANDELAQSYMAQPKTGRRVRILLVMRRPARKGSNGVLACLAEHDIRPTLEGELEIHPRWRKIDESARVVQS